MKKTIFAGLVLALMCVGLTQLKAQDYIYLRDQSPRLAVKSLDIGKSETKYQLFDNSTSTVFAVNNIDISMITFEDGKVRFFENEVRIKTEYDYNANLFTFHLFDLIVNEFTISYEHIFNQGQIGLQIPLSVGFSDSNINGFDDIDNKFYSGLSLNFYPTGQGKVRYFLGPGFQLGNGEYEESYYYGGQYENRETFFFRFFVNNGLVISPVKDMSLTVIGSIGVRYLGNPDENHDEIKTVGAFAFNLSYRF